MPPAAMAVSTRVFPSLSQSTVLRFIAFALLYFAQGVPYGFLSITMPARLADQGVDAGGIGAFLGVITLPWSFKLIYGPIIDRWSFLAMGRRRPWILLGQFGLLASLLGMAAIPDPVQNFAALMAMGFVMNVFAAMQDVATDGMAIDLLPVEQQARANGIMWGAKMIGIAATGAGSAWLLTRFGLAAACLFGAMIVALVSFIPLLLRERAGERLLPWGPGEASEAAKAMQVKNIWTIGRDLWKASRLPASLLLGMAAFAYCVGSGLFDASMPVLSTQELSWKVTEFSNVRSMGSMCGGIFGMLIGGYLVDRFGRMRVMRILVVLYMVLHGCMAALGSYWHNSELVTVYIIGHEFFYTLVTIAVFAVAMEICWKRVAATQFTLYMMISNLGSAVGSAALGPVHSWGGYGLVLTAIAFSAGIMLLLLRFADMARHGENIRAIEAVSVFPGNVAASPGNPG